MQRVFHLCSGSAIGARICQTYLSARQGMRIRRYMLFDGYRRPALSVLARMLSLCAPEASRCLHLPPQAACKRLIDGVPLLAQPGRLCVQQALLSSMHRRASMWRCVDRLVWQVMRRPESVANSEEWMRQASSSFWTNNLQEWINQQSPKVGTRASIV